MGALFEVEDVLRPATEGPTAAPSQSPRNEHSVEDPDLHHQGIKSHYNCYETPGDYDRCLPLYIAAGIFILGMMGCLLAFCLRRRERNREIKRSKMTMSGRETEMGRTSAFQGVNPMQDSKGEGKGQGRGRRTSSLSVEGDDEEEDGNHFFDKMIDEKVSVKEKTQARKVNEEEGAKEGIKKGMKEKPLKPPPTGARKRGPSVWEQFYDEESGHNYYVNSENGESSWDLPTR